MNIKVTNLCSICAGTKELLTGKPCGCKDGTIHGELHFIRMEVFKAQEQRDAALKLADKWEGDERYSSVLPRHALSDCARELRAIFAQKE